MFTTNTQSDNNLIVTQSTPWRKWYVATAVLSGLGVLGKASLLKHFFLLPAPIVVAMVALFLVLPFFWSYVVRARQVVAPAALLVLCFVFIFFYPKVIALHQQGRGSDQSDCIIAAADKLLEHQWPYQHALFSSRNAMSCGPGWVALQTPSTGLLGYKWTLVLFWALSVAAIAYSIGWDKTSGFVSLVALSPGLWVTAANGSDFLTFGIVLTAVIVAVRKLHLRSAAAIGFVSILVGLVAQFRVPTLLIPAFLRNRIGKWAAILSWAFATLCQAAFLMWNAQAFIVDGPLHVIYKLMRMKIISSNPEIAALEFVLSSAIGFAILYAFNERIRASSAIFFYLFAIFAVPAAQNFILKYRDQHSLLRALEFWEGGTWIVACLPFAALALIEELSHRREPRTLDSVIETAYT